MHLIYSDYFMSVFGIVFHKNFMTTVSLFQRTRKPYDEKDIMDQFAGGQVEIYGHLKLIEKQ